MSSQNEISIMPLPNNKFMESNKQLITGINENGRLNYSPNGEYEITASSYASNDTQPYNICNRNTNDYWQCDFKSNQNFISGKYDQYTQNAYDAGVKYAPYRGGGSSKNTWTTTIGKNNNIRGEWLQVHIPYQAYLTNYSIETPPYSRNNTFPMKFVLVASNDGNSWVQLDQQNLYLNELPTSKQVKRTFKVVSVDRYSYFRLIFSQMGPEISTVKISQFGLFGKTMLEPKINNRRETFITLSRSIELTDKPNTNNNLLYVGINPYDKQYAEYNRVSDEREFNNVDMDQVYTDNINSNSRLDQNMSKVLNEYLLQSNIIAYAILTAAVIYTYYTQ